MEVHHHAHSHGKKWTHYFWEFLMLFLAVFCGFLAENFREHKVEHVRAKEFARSLVKDLHNDTAAIEFYKKAERLYVSVCDTLLHLNKSRLEGPNATKFSFYARFMYWTAGVSWNRTTFEQIKNSGSLRYFKHRLLEKLMKYDAAINEIEREFSNHETRGNDLLYSINKTLDPQMHQDVSRLFLWSLDTISRSTLDTFLSTKVPSLEGKRDVITELLNMIVVQQRNLRRGEEPLVQAKNLAGELINEFTDEYHLK
ncbi:MAG TPA: hypothetical protein VLJ68_04700 [Chitinophagaceae bacterium]|nr:hypothetical protein [Chitinophagaceae bacterium]